MPEDPEEQPGGLLPSAENESKPEDLRATSQLFRWLGQHRTAALCAAMIALSGIIGLNVYLIASGTRPASPTAPTLSARGFSNPLKPILADPLDALFRRDDTESRREPGKRDSSPSTRTSSRVLPGTVHEASARSCSTEIVAGLSRQIIAQARCIDPNAFVAVPARPNLTTHGHVFLYLDASARDRLVKTLDAHRDRKMTIDSALRTVAQQYLLWRWSANRRCGIQLATKPGESNHESGLAFDIAEAGKWRSALEAEDFRWLGAIDRVHFDYKGRRASPRDNLDVLAFQQLWNRNHPEDSIAENGRYDPDTNERLKKAPAQGFPAGALCDKKRASSR